LSSPAHFANRCGKAAGVAAGGCLPGCASLTSLKPLAGALAGSASPAATLKWLGKPHIRDLLTRLASGKLPLTHEALDGWPRTRAVAYLRDLLVSCGALPAADRQLREFQTWLDRRLDTVAEHPHLRLLRQFGLWHQLSGMRARASSPAPGRSSPSSAGSTCCAASPPMRPSRSGPAPPRA
jgi:hypothetical protein